jgi:hypothetical protein
VPADKGEALRLFRLAVEQGEPKAQSEVERLEGPIKRPRVRVVDATVPGRNFGLVGGVPPWEDERIRQELLEVLKSGEDDTAAERQDVVEATDDELFPMFAECGMKPEDFVEEMAERYAAYLERNATPGNDHV